ncbi:MAG: DNA-3-methyladenine glycosylase 2 family protein [Deltaproteobacteria bacterium]|nr:DNA-3-methyladenine glycosylase 2 family protein [Deltaproteobacteria bacterium]
MNEVFRSTGICKDKHFHELKYKKPFNFKQVLSFLKRRAMAGVEAVTETRYSRTFRMKNATGFFTITDKPDQSALELRIGCDDIRCHTEIHNRVRKVFDLDTDFSLINERCAKDEYLSKGMVAGHVPRLPAAFDPFEFVVRAILGQQISVQAATTLASRVAAKADLKSDGGYLSGLNYFFPNPSELLDLELDGLGIPRTKQATLKTVAQAILDQRVKLTADQPFETFSKDFSALKGIGEWTVHYVAMRGLRMVDSFPTGDLGVIKALTKKGRAPSKKEITEMAEQWRPYRAYAALCLWNDQGTG